MGPTSTPNFLSSAERSSSDNFVGSIEADDPPDFFDELFLGEPGLLFLWLTLAPPNESSSSLEKTPGLKERAPCKAGHNGLFSFLWQEG